jgi:hypothetical protein
MKSSLLISAFLMVILIAGCSATPAAGPAGPQGPPGQDAHDRDRDRDRDHDRQAQVAPCPAGEHQQTDNGRTECVRDR